MQTLRPLRGLLLGLLAAVPIDLQATADAPAVTASSAEDLVGCRSVAAAQARLACYDQAADQALLRAGRAVPPLPPAPATDPTELFGLPPDEVRRRAEEQLGLPTPDVIEARVSSVSRLPTGKVQVQLDNGQRWQQIDTTASALKPGDAVRIRRGSIGSYLLERASGGFALRVRRLPAAGPD